LTIRGLFFNINRIHEGLYDQPENENWRRREEKDIGRKCKKPFEDEIDRRKYVKDDFHFGRGNGVIGRKRA